jgi:GcrA cell cycle regulator
MAGVDERNSRIKELWISGLSGKQIAEQVGITRNAVMGIIHRAGLQRGDGVGGKAVVFPKEKERELNQLRIAGFMPSEIAKKLAVKPQQVSKKLYKIRQEHAGKPISLLELTEWTCRFPVTDDVPFMFCGAAADNRFNPYCQAHDRIACRGSAPPLVPAEAA